MTYVLYVATLAMKLEREAPKRQDRIPSIVNIQGEGVLFSLSTRAPILRAAQRARGRCVSSLALNTLFIAALPM